MSKSEIVLLKHNLAVKHNYEMTGLRTIVGNYILNLYRCTTCGRDQWSISDRIEMEVQHASAKETSSY
ncbi:hypothetical protein FET70_01662 [Lactiplantibacillus plantarum]|nr:hypothetical protein FET70_01662 [Lactiplantibacillus plantarum]